jgi:prepilin-type N-terminal cleavage/methylation domain-containing protein
MRHATPRNHQAGFTLVELLVSLALTTAIVSFIIGEIAEEIDAAATRLRGLLARAMPLTTIDEVDRTSRLLFEGQSNSIVFVTLSEATAFEGGPMRVRLSWQDRPPLPGRPAALVLHTAVFRHNPRLVLDSKPVVLFRNVVGFSLRYFGAPARDPPAPQWHSEWLDHDRMPLAVLVQIDLATGNSMRQIILQTTLRLAPTN